MSRAFTRAAFATAAAASLVASLAACSSGGDSSGASTITVMAWGTSEDIQSIRDAAAGYIEENPDITVDILTGDCAVVYATCKQLIAGGNMPDVVVPGSWNYDAMVRDGVLSDLTESLSAAGVDESDFTPAALDVAKSVVDDKLHGLPMGYNIQSLFFNQDMFDAAGLAYPDAGGDYTWDDIRTWARQLTLDANGNNADSPDFDADQIVQYGMHFGVTDQWPNLVARSFGGSVLGGSDYDQCGLEEPETLTAFEFVQGMMFDDRSAINWQQNLEEPGYQRWVTGSVAMQIGSHEQVGLARAQNPDMRFDIAPAPTGDAGQVTMLQEHLWAAYAGSDNLATAEDFVVYMSTTGAGKQMGLIPAYRDLATTDFATAEGEPANIVAGQLEPAEWPGLFLNIDPKGIREAVAGQDGYGQLMVDLFSGTIPAADALPGSCSAVDELISAAE